MTPKSRDGGAAYAPGVTSLLRTSKLAVGALQTWLTDIRARSEVGDMIAAIAGFLARPQKARPMAGCGSERTVVGRTPAAIVVQIPAVSIGVLEGARTTLTMPPITCQARMWVNVVMTGAFASLIPQPFSDLCRTTIKMRDHRQWLRHRLESFTSRD
jgi:hypothetical protein